MVSCPDRTTGGEDGSHRIPPELRLSPFFPETEAGSRGRNRSCAGPETTRSLSIDRVRTLQESLRRRVRLEDRRGPLRTVCGVDAGYSPDGLRIRAAAVLLDYESLATLESVVLDEDVTFPYIPGLLSFREVPALSRAVRGLGSVPDVVLCDGQGIAHPCRFGLACHLGVLLGLPSVGVAKRRLVGCHEVPGPERGAWVPLRHKGETVGAVLRTRAGVRPVYVSAGHRMTLETAVALTLHCAQAFRLPETTRRAHALATWSTGR